MECGACGAILREGARFCNNCGASQGDMPGESQTSTPASTTGSPSVERESGAGASGRTRRPPRVPRASDTARTADSAASARAQTVPVATDILDMAALAAASHSTATPEAEPDAAELTEPELTEPEAGLSPSLTPGSGASEVAPEPPETASVPPSPHESVAAPEPESSAGTTAESPAPTAGEDASPSAWEDADTIEYSVIVARGQTLDAASSSSPPAQTEMPALDELARSRDALSWPLPQNIIVGGRYRVEEVLTVAPDAPGAENIYRVHDLQGYERCWSCGAEHGATAAGDRFCQECGADMLTRDFLMHERRASVPTDAPAAAAAGGETPEEAPDDGSSGDAAIRVFSQGARAYRIVPRPAAPPLFPHGVRIVAAMATDTGASRAGEENEDSVGIVALSVGHDSFTDPLTLCVVADGLGGHASGQTASRLVVRLLAEHVLRALALPFVAPAPADAGGQETVEAALLGALKNGIELANKAICASNSSSGADMGSTCVAALIHRDTAYFANAGDSRAYVLEDDGLRRITTDHSLVEQLIAGGLITPEERYTHPQRNQIFRSLGDEPDVPLDTFTQKLRPGMRLLLCSDGLWEMVRDDEMAHMLRETSGTQQVCDLLVQTANAHGGEDNISAIVVDICA